MGNQVKNQDFEQATFMDMGNSPATIESARLCDIYGCLKGHMVAVANVVQAYIQAELGGDMCWINLPREAWPEYEDGTGIIKQKQEMHKHNSIVEKWRTMRNPVTILRMALDGHPDRVTMWEAKCDLDVKSAGFVAIGPECPSVYYHKELQLLLII